MGVYWRAKIVIGLTLEELYDYREELDYDFLDELTEKHDKLELVFPYQDCDLYDQIIGYVVCNSEDYRPSECDIREIGLAEYRDRFFAIFGKEAKLLLTPSVG